MPRKLSDGIPTLYCTGISEIKNDGVCAHITWNVLTQGSTPFAVFEMVVPTDYLTTAVKKLGAAALLLPDKIGKPVGQG